jgi:hypothetical protein
MDFGGRGGEFTRLLLWKVFLYSRICNSEWVNSSLGSGLLLLMRTTGGTGDIFVRDSTMPNYLGSDVSCARLRQAGWSIGEIRGISGLWFVTGTNGESLIRAEGASQAEAWYLATLQSEEAGILRS